MKELFSELRFKDYMILGLIIIALIFVMNLQHIINKNLPKINPADFEMETVANIVQVKPLQRKTETLEGSKLKPIGYNLEIEYQVDSVSISKELIILYTVYKADRTEIDRLVLSKDKLLPIRLKREDVESVVLNTLHSE